MIDEMDRPLGHPPTAAPRTESPALARQGDEAIQSACVASKSDEAAGEASAPQEVAELLLDKPREPLAVPQRTERLKWSRTIPYKMVASTAYPQTVAAGTCPAHVDLNSE